MLYIIMDAVKQIIDDTHVDVILIVWQIRDHIAYTINRTNFSFSTAQIVFQYNCRQFPNTNIAQTKRNI